MIRSRHKHTADFKPNVAIAAVQPKQFDPPAVRPLRISIYPGRVYSRKNLRRQYPTNLTSVRVAILRQLAMQMHDPAASRVDKSLISLAFSYFCELVAVALFLVRLRTFFSAELFAND
jgi:hypothetical protein